MEKLYSRTNWVEDSAPFINAENLNNIESGIDAIDDRVVELSAQAKNFATKEEIPEVNIATSEKVGLVKPDGSTTYIDSDGTIHAVGGGGGGTGGTSNYNDLSNKPSINGVSLQGNKTLEDIGAEARGSASEALSEAKDYTDEKVSNIPQIQFGTFKLNDGSYNLTFPTPFSEPPAVVASPAGTANAVVSVKVNDITKNGCSFMGHYSTGSNTIVKSSATVYWIAIGK